MQHCTDPPNFVPRVVPSLQSNASQTFPSLKSLLLLFSSQRSVCSLRILKYTINTGRTKLVQSNFGWQGPFLSEPFKALASYIHPHLQDNHLPRLRMNPNDPNAHQVPQPNHSSGIPPQYYSFMAQPSVYPMQPPPTGMPFMTSTMPGMPPLYSPFASQPVYPTGQGPLADVSATRGENGLYQAPEPEGPEPHEAKPFLRLNPAEAAKYIEYWDLASDGEDTVSGAHAVSFLSRAPKVSKAQLRRVWEVADHRKEGFLDQEQFYIALRLVALAQRGAELSVAGLRNFTGIQLIPNISPPPPPPPPEPEPSSEPLPDSSTGTLQAPTVGSAGGSSFSWIITLQIAQKFDDFFNGLAANGGPLLDATAVVPFFVKSGLPKSTLRTIWQLADVTKDGKLSREEFRTAMHLVTCIRNRRITVEELPDYLDPNGLNWVRIEGEPLPEQAPVVGMPQSTPVNVSLQGEQADSASQSLLSTPSLGLAHPGSSQQLTDQAVETMPALDHSQPFQIPAVQNLPDEGTRQEAMWRQEAQAERDERRRMLEELRLEREEMERTRREMEAMRTEMLQLRLGNSTAPNNMGAAPQNAQKLPQTTPEQQVNLSQSAEPQSSTNHEGTLLGELASESNVPSQNRSNTVLDSSALNSSQSASQTKSVFVEDDVIPTTHRKKNDIRTDNKINEASREGDADSDNDEDDDDFWGGLGPKPTLGASGTQNANSNGANGGTSAVTKTFGGTELDDWVF